MSKPTTMEDRAAAYAKRSGVLNDDGLQDFLTVHLAPFAASEVARVREEQADALRELSRLHRLRCLFDDDDLAEPIKVIDESTRPDAPRAKAKEPPSEPPYTPMPASMLGVMFCCICKYARSSWAKPCGKCGRTAKQSEKETTDAV